MKIIFPTNRKMPTVYASLAKSHCPLLNPLLIFIRTESEICVVVYSTKRSSFLVSPPIHETCYTTVLTIDLNGRCDIFLHIATIPSGRPAVLKKSNRSYRKDLEAADSSLLIELVLASPFVIVKNHRKRIKSGINRETKNSKKACIFLCSDKRMGPYCDSLGIEKVVFRQFDPQKINAHRAIDLQ